MKNPDVNYPGPVSPSTTDSIRSNHWQFFLLDVSNFKFPWRRNRPCS